MAVNVAHVGDPSTAHEVAVTYVKGGQTYQVRGNHCVLACWNSVIPYLCPDLPAASARRSRYGIKAPIVYTSVLIRDWTSFQKLGVSNISAPGGYHSSVGLAEP